MKNIGMFFGFGAAILFGLLGFHNPRIQADIHSLMHSFFAAAPTAWDGEQVPGAANDSGPIFSHGDIPASRMIAQAPESVSPEVQPDPGPGRRGFGPPFRDGRGRMEGGRGDDRFAEFQRRFPELVDTMEKLNRLHIHMKSVWDEYHQSQDERRKTILRQRLRAMLDREFDLEVQRHNFEIKVLEQKLQDLKAQLNQQKQQKDVFLANRLETLTTKSDLPEWFFGGPRPDMPGGPRQGPMGGPGGSRGQRGPRGFRGPFGQENAGPVSPVTPETEP